MKVYRVLPRLVGLCLVVLLAAPLSPTARAGEDDYSRQQLTQMLAPVALYPDALLSQVLMAATYPLEVVTADRWVRRNPLLTGANLDEALWDHDWDASVKALCHVPEVLALMSERLDETTNLGNAFLAQENEVLDVVQELRSRAYREGNLHSDDKQKVIVKADGTIVIAPADPQTVYVPYYNTRYVYGPWWYPAWPPWYWGPSEVVIGSTIYFWPDVYFGFSYGFGYWSYPDWANRTIIFDVRRRPRFFRRDYDWQSRQGRWRHESSHRRGVVYRDRSTAERFGQVPGRSPVYDRRTRGFPERDRTGRAPTGVRREDAVRGPLTTRGATTAPPLTRAGTVERTGQPVRPQVERQSVIVPTTNPAARVPRRREGSGTIFGGAENGREESRSSIRGRASRDSMERSRVERGFSSGRDQGQERGGGRGRSLR
jgi:hypothetical protein